MLSYWIGELFLSKFLIPPPPCTALHSLPTLLQPSLPQPFFWIPWYPRFPPRFPLGSSQISPRFPLGFLQISPQVSPRFPSDFPQVSPRFPQVFFIFTSSFHHISSRFLKGSPRFPPRDQIKCSNELYPIVGYSEIFCNFFLFWQKIFDTKYYFSLYIFKIGFQCFYYVIILGCLWSYWIISVFRMTGERRL